MLSLALFLKHYILFHEIQPEQGTKVRLYCDNLALITTMKKLLAYDSYHAEVHTWPHFDIINEIAIVIDQLPLEIKLLHVKSHQHKKIPFEQLPLPAKRNVQADHLATDSLQEQIHNEPAPFIPLPNCLAYLQYKGEYICAHELTKLREILPGKKLL